MSIISRFCDHIENDDSNCWLWKSSRDNVYGQFWINGNTVAAHRFSFELFNNDILTSEDFVCHLCNNKRCVNPDHLFLGDAVINRAHADACGLNKPKDQRFNRLPTVGRILPKGISYNILRNSYKCQIRVGVKRYQTWKKTLAEAIEWRSRQEHIHWKIEESNLQQETAK